MAFMIQEWSASILTAAVFGVAFAMAMTTGY